MSFHLFRVRRFFGSAPGLTLLLFGLIDSALARPDPGTYRPGQLLVKLKPAPPGRAQLTPAHPSGLRIKATMPKVGWQLLELPAGMSVPDAMEYYRKQPEVADVEPNYPARLFATPNDPRRTAQWALEKINAASAWDQTTGSAGIVVATLDTGIDFTHPDLAANIWTNPGETPGNNLDDDHNGYIDDIHGINVLNHTANVSDDEGHGTHVAGTIGAVGNNGLGVVGLNWNVRIISVKMFSADDSAGTAGAVEGYDYLIALKQRGVNVRIVNNSWGSPFPSRALYDALRAAEAAGILTVCAAGNSSWNTDQRPSYPAGLDCQSLISVAASTPDDELASFSNFGQLTVALAAPGESVLSTYRGAGHYLVESGTSMASPHVAGAAALLLAQNNSLTPSALKALLMATVDPLASLQSRVISGGRLNIGRAIAQLVTGPLPSLPPLTNELVQTWPRISGISRATNGLWGTGTSLMPAISSNGQIVAFLSAATNLAPGVSSTRTLVYRHDRATRATTLVSRSNTGSLPNADCADVKMSGDGRFVVFSSAAGNLSTSDFNGASDVFLYDHNSGQLELISSTGAFAGSGTSEYPDVSADGRYIVFASDASDLVSGDINGYRDIFLRDRQLGTTTLLSVSSAGVHGRYPSDAPSISADGRYVTFLSVSDNLVPDVWNQAWQLYLRDRVGNTTVRISRSSTAQPGSTNSGFSSLSADGRYIAFESLANNLVPGDTNNLYDVYLWDRVALTMKRVSLGNNGAQPDQDCVGPFVTANGRHVCFFSASSNLFPQDDNPAYDIFDFDRLTAKLSRLTYNQAGREELDDSYLPVASADGRFVAFASYAWNLVPADGNGSSDIFCIDRGAAIVDLSIYATGETNLQGLGLHGVNIMQRRELPLTNTLATFYIRLDNDGPTNETFSLRANLPPAGWSAQFLRNTTNISAAVTASGYAISLPAGSNIVFRLDVSSLGAAVGESWAEWIITASGTSSNAATDAVRAVVTRTPSPPALQAISRAADGHLGNDDNGPADLSADGRFVTFTSVSSDLTGRDYNFGEDVFVLDRQTRVLECISKLADGTNGNGRSYSSRISRDGRYVVFQSSATNLVAGDINDREDVFLFDRQTHTTSLISTGPGGVRSARDSGSVSLSGDGRYAAFESLSDNFVPNDGNGTWDIFLRDVSAGTNQCLSLAAGQTANDESHNPVISTDGSMVVFSSLAGNLVAADTNNTTDLFLWQRGVPGVRLLSRASDGRAGNDFSGGASISDDNRWILFASKATDLAVSSYDTNSVTFLYDRSSDQLSQIVPPKLVGRQRGRFYGARLAPDGRLITLLADVTEGAGSSNYFTGVFLYDRLSGNLTELTRKRDGAPANDYSSGATVSADSRWVLLDSRAGNLLGEINPGVNQLLLYDRASFQPDEWIRRGSNAPNRGQDLFAGSAQRVEMTIPFNATNVFFLTIRNYGNASDQFIFRAPTNVTGGINARYFLQATGAEISSTATNAGWVSDVVTPGGSREVRVQITASNTNLFNQDIIFTSTSLSDPTKMDIVSLRLLRDDDNDGLPNTWEQQYFLNPTNAVASADTDGDGFSNSQEYAAGTNPTNRNSSLRITSIQPGPGRSVTITWPSATNRFYAVERSLGAPAAFNEVTHLFGQGVTSSYLDTWPTNPPPAFYRIRAELP